MRRRPPRSTLFPYTTLVRSEHHLSPCALVVHDWGGLIGLRWACEHVDSLCALVVSGTGFFPDERWGSEEHTSELQSRQYIACRLLLERKYDNALLSTRVAV